MATQKEGLGASLAVANGLTVRATRRVKALAGDGGALSDEAFERGANELSELFADAADLLRVEDGDAALALAWASEDVSQEPKSVFRPNNGRFGERPAVENYLGALSRQGSGVARELGLAGLARSRGMFCLDSERLTDKVFENMRDAMFGEDRSRPDRMARELTRNPLYLSLVKSSPKRAMGFSNLVGCWLDLTVKEWGLGERGPQESKMIARDALGELLDAAESMPEVINGVDQTPGWLLMSIARFDSCQVGLAGQELHAWLSQRARSWIEKGVHVSEQGELAAALCEGMSAALDYGQESGLKESVLTLKTALTHGLGASRESGSQPLRILLGFGGLENPGKEGRKALVAEAAEALIAAGADERDVVERVERALTHAPNQGLASRLRALRESREITASLGEMSSEEAAAVAEFLRARREAAGQAPGGPGACGAPPRRRPGL